MVPVSSRSHLVNKPSLPPPPSYQAATQSGLYNLTPSKQFTQQQHQRHHIEHRQQHTPVTSPHVPVTSSLPASLVAPAITSRDRKMSFQVDSSTWKDREPTHFRWNMMAVAKRDKQEFHHKLPTCYDEVTSTLILSFFCSYILLYLFIFFLFFFYRFKVKD